MKPLAILFIGVLVAIAPILSQGPASDGATRADWPHYGGTQSAWRYSALDQINTANVNNLAPAWMFQTGDYADNLHSTPIVVDGVIYIITPRNWVFALDAATGRLLWQHKPMAPRPGPAGGQAFVLNRGVAVADGKVFYGSTDNFLVALDQKTGREVWKVSIDDPKQCGCNVTSAPLVVKDKVVVGGTGGELAHRGYLTAFDAATGRFAWRFHVIPAPGEKGNETWKGDSWKFGGGAPWMTGSYDPELNLVYWGTGNASGDFFDGDRAAGTDKSSDTNLYTNSVVALDGDTGKLRWHHQEIPADVWDYDSAYEVQLSADAERGRQLFSDAVRSFERCATCHEVDGIGIPVSTPITNIPADVPTLRRLATPQVMTATTAGETMAALLVSNGKRATIYYDLSTPPPVLRTAEPGSVQFTSGSSWQHGSVIGSYNDGALEAILTYLRAVVR